MQTKILIADDHPLVINGLLSILKDEKELELITPVNNGHELLQSIAKYPPDLIILDLNMPKLDGIESLGILKDDFPSIKVIVLSSYNHSEIIEIVKKMGAKGYLLKDTPYHELRQSIFDVINGTDWVQNTKTELEAETSSYYIDNFMRKYQLSKREVEIVGMIARGCTSKEIGDNLFISEFTVTTHRRNILRKLNIKSIAKLVLFAKENGLVL